MILEREMLIQNIAAYTSEEVIRCRGYPIAQMEYVVEHKHNSSTHNGIDDTHHYKFHKGLVGE